MVIEDDPLTAYCYTAVHSAGKEMLIAYCAGSQQEGHLNRLRIRNPQNARTCPKSLNYI